MIEEITIKFGTELKPTQASWKSQLYMVYSKCYFVKKTINNREMLTDALRVLVNNPFKENFYGKRKKKSINVLTAFSISYKNSVKTFLK